METNNEKRKAYRTDLSDHEWELIAPFIPEPKPGGRPPDHPRREIVNAIFYLTRTGIGWREMPHDLPNWSTVYQYYWRWSKSGLWQDVLEHLNEAERLAQGRNARPSAGSLDSQSVKTTEQASAEQRGYDVAKATKGRKRHILVDTLGLLLFVCVTSASVSDEEGARRLLSLAWWRTPFKGLRLLWADSAYYRGKLLGFAKAVYDITLEIVRPEKGTKGFKVLPRRWVVERTFGWLNRYRRLSKDYERQTWSSEALITLAMIRLLLRRHHRRLT